MTAVDYVRPAQSEPNRLMITLIAMAAVTMQRLDTTIANVALPHMQGSLGATQDEVAWVLTSYIVAAAIATPITGWLAGRFGRTWFYVVALAGFTFTSALCGLAVTLPQIVLFRVLQGLFGAALVPLSQAILLDAYPRSEMGRAMSIFSMGVMMAPILGPVVGGYLTDEYSWRWCFYINVPLGILAIVGALAFIPETVIATKRKLDWFGFGFLSLTVASLQMMLDRGEQQGWFQSTEIIIEATLTIFAFYMFIVHSSTTNRPFFDVRLFKDRTFVVSTTIMTLIFIVYYGSMVLTPQMLQQELNYPVLTAGLIMAPRGVGTVLTILVVSRLSKWIGPRPLIATGLVISGISLFLMSGWSQMVSSREIVWVGLLSGAANGFINVPITTIAFVTLSQELRTEATGLYNLMRNIGSAVGVSIASAQLVESTQINHGYLSAFMTHFRQLPMMPGMDATRGLMMMNLGLTQQAAMVAFINVFWMLAVLSIAITPLVLFLKIPKTGPAPSGAAAAAAAGE
jgi:DHA2 family multidrug resistance protein